MNMRSHGRLVIGLLWAKMTFKISLLFHESKMIKRKKKKEKKEKKRKKKEKESNEKSNFLIFFDFDYKLPICKFESFVCAHTKLWNMVSCMRIRSLSVNLFFAVHVIAEKRRLEISKFGWAMGQDDQKIERKMR